MQKHAYFTSHACPVDITIRLPGAPHDFSGVYVEAALPSLTKSDMALLIA